MAHRTALQRVCESLNNKPMSLSFQNPPRQGDIALIHAAHPLVDGLSVILGRGDLSYSP
jgi:hypothetical protein